MRSSFLLGCGGVGSWTGLSSQSLLNEVKFPTLSSRAKGRHFASSQSLLNEVKFPTFNGEVVAEVDNVAIPFK